MPANTFLSKEEKEAFFEEHDGLLISLAIRYKSCGFEFEDLLQEIRCAACRALNKYDPDRGIKVTTFVYCCAERDILQMIRQKKAKKRSAVVVSLNLSVDINGDEREPLLNLDLNGVDFMHTYYANLDGQLQGILRWQSVKMMIDELPREERIAVEMYLQGYSQANIGKRLSISQSKV